MGSVRSRLSHSDSENVSTLSHQRWYRAVLIGVRLGPSKSIDTQQTGNNKQKCLLVPQSEPCHVKGWMTVEGVNLIFVPSFNLPPVLRRSSTGTPRIHCQIPTPVHVSTCPAAASADTTPQTSSRRIRSGSECATRPCGCTEALYWPIATLRTYGINKNIFTFETGRRAPNGEGCYQFKIKNSRDFNEKILEPLHVPYTDPTRPHGGISLPGSALGTPRTRHQAPTHPLYYNLASDVGLNPDLDAIQTSPKDGSQYGESSGGGSSWPAQIQGRSRLGSSVSDGAPSQYYNIGPVFNAMNGDEDNVFNFTSPPSSLSSHPRNASSLSPHLATPNTSSSSQSKDSAMLQLHRLNYIIIDFDNIPASSSAPSGRKPPIGPSSSNHLSPANNTEDDMCHYVHICDQQTEAVRDLHNNLPLKQTPSFDVR